MPGHIRPDHRPEFRVTSALRDPRTEPDAEGYVTTCGDPCCQVHRVKAGTTAIAESLVECEADMAEPEQGRGG